MATRKVRPVLYELVKRKTLPSTTRPGAPAFPPHDAPPPGPELAPPRSAPPRSARTTAEPRAGVSPRLGPPLNGRPASAAAVAVMNRLLRHVGGPGGVVIAVVVVFALLAIWQSLVYLRNQSAQPRDLSSSGAPAAPAPAVPALAGGVGRATPSAGDFPRPLPPRAPAPAPSVEDRPPPDAGAKPAPAEPPPTAPPPPAGAPLVLEKGRHYVVVQHFRSSEREAARAATAYLQSHGVAVALDESPREYRLIALEPFLLDQKEAAARQREQKRVDALKQQIRALGREYARTAGYAFDQCYERKF